MLTLAIAHSNQPSSLSSTHSSTRMPCPGPRAASLGNNGNQNGFQEWRCARTLKEAYPWWEVDLGSEQSISSVHLWKAMTYHEHPKHPAGQPPITSTASTGLPSPPLWLIVSSSPLDSNGKEALSNAQSSSMIVARQIVFNHDSRVESVQFAVDESNSSAAVGRYVRLQHESTLLSVLQFAELEVIATASEGSFGVVLLHDDGFYGVENALDGDSHEYIDSEWLKPSSNLAQVRFWIGSYNEKLPAVQWMQNDETSATHEAVSVKLQYHQRQVEDGSWKPIHVDARSSVLLDKESIELVADIETFKEQGKLDLCDYLNNDSLSSSSPRTVSLGSGNQSPYWLLQFDWIKAIKPEIAEKLLGKIETKIFAEGSSILAYGERKRGVFFLCEGEIELVGPQTSLGAKSIGKLERGTVFNELSLFGVWPETIAELKTSESVTCEFLSLDSLIQVLGAERVASIRAQFIRYGTRSFASATFKQGLADTGKVVHYTDSTRVQVFRTKVPLNAFASAAASANPAALSHRFELEIYEYAKDAKKQGAKIGTVHLLPSQLSSHGEGYLTLPIHSSQGGGGVVIGQLSLTFLVIKPFVHPMNNLSNVWRSYWRPRMPLNVGHRGMGRSYHQVPEFRYALTRENTLASFILASRSGADFVEFDVQLTKDYVPVLYHDFMLNVGLEDKNAWTHGSKAEEYEIGVHEMTLRQLQRSQTTPASRVKGKNKLQQRVRKHLTQVLSSSGHTKNSGSLALKRKQEGSVAKADEDHLVEFFPKLEDLLKHVPAEVGLNVEIKYPDNVWRTAMRLSPPFALNEYVDAIVKCVFEHAGLNRRIFFSCFDANLCVLLRAKQATYPVFFLTYGSILPHAFDARQTLQFAVNFVEMERLGGIVSNSDVFIANPELVQIVKKKAATKKSVGGPVTPAVLLTWGDKNTGHEAVQLQKQAAMDGVISDNIGDLVRQDAKLFMKQE